MQRCLDDLGTSLADVTFCVVDLETTGGDPAADAITEVGAVKVRGGECLGTLQTLVDPGCAIPPGITVLTGITEAMVVRAPRIGDVLPSLLDFVDGTVVVGHNVRFDLGFLRLALDRAGYGRLPNPWVDTCALARRLVADEVPDCRLGTLADRFRLDHRPTHRALADALATTDLLHLLLERAGPLGVTGLDDLLALPTVTGHRQLTKLRLTGSLPRRPGVYLFRDDGGRVLHVGRATDLRARVRSYFSGDGRRHVGSLLRETTAVDHVECSSPLEAAVLEVRLVQELAPRYDRQSKNRRRYAYLELTLAERFPRLAVVADPKDDGGLYVGPLPSRRDARLAAEAVETVVPLRRCTARPPRQPRATPCPPAQMGVAACPCAGAISPGDYAAIVDRAVRGLTADPSLLLGPLDDRLRLLAARQRFEEAAEVRDRAAALAAALGRQRRLDALRSAGRTVLELAGDTRAELDRGRLVGVGRAPAVGRGTGAPAPAVPVVTAAVGDGRRRGGTGDHGAGAAARPIEPAGQGGRDGHGLRRGRAEGPGRESAGVANDDSERRGAGADAVGPSGHAPLGPAVHLASVVPLRSIGGADTGGTDAGAADAGGADAGGTDAGGADTGGADADGADEARPSAAMAHPAGTSGRRRVAAASPSRTPGGLPPVPRDVADELACIAAWLDDEAGRLRVVHSEHGLALPATQVPTFEPGHGAEVARTWDGRTFVGQWAGGAGTVAT